MDLPRYTRPKRLASGQTAYFWSPPTWATKKDCPLIAEALGADLGLAIVRATELNRHFDDWRAGETKGPTPGTVSWLVREFQKSTKYKKTKAKTQRSYDQGLALIEAHALESGRKFGDVPVKSVQPRHVDALYERIQWVGERRRLATANAAMRAARRMWSVAIRQGYADSNPFAKMDLEAPRGETALWNRDQVYTFVAKADAMGYRSMGTAATLAFELCQREGDVIGTITWANYRQGQEIRVRQAKTDSLVWVPLHDEEGELFPGLIDRLEGTPRRGSLIVMRDKPDRKRKTYLPYAEHWFRHLFRKIADAAGLAPALTFMGLRHAGLTELGDAGATDQELMSHSGHKTRQTLTVYTRRTGSQAANAARKRRALRTKTGYLSE